MEKEEDQDNIPYEDRKYTYKQIKEIVDLNLKWNDKYKYVRGFFYALTGAMQLPLAFLITGSAGIHTFVIAAAITTVVWYTLDQTVIFIRNYVDRKNSKTKTKGD